MLFPLLSRPLRILVDRRKFKDFCPRLVAFHQVQIVTWVDIVLLVGVPKLESVACAWLFLHSIV